MKLDIELKEYKSYNSDGLDSFTRATLNGKEVLLYYIGTDMSATNIVIYDGVSYTCTSINGDVNIPSHNVGWMSSDGSIIPEWLDDVIAYL